MIRCRLWTLIRFSQWRRKYFKNWGLLVKNLNKWVKFWTKIILWREERVSIDIAKAHLELAAQESTLELLECVEFSTSKTVHPGNRKNKIIRIEGLNINESLGVLNKWPVHLRNRKSSNIKNKEDMQSREKKYIEKWKLWTTLNEQACFGFKV